MYRSILAIVAASLFSLNAFGHTQLSASLPANDARVTSPHEIVLEFGGDVRLTSVTLADASGVEKAVAKAPADVAARFVLGVQDELAPGSYSISWRCVGADTHIVSGEIAFTVVAKPI
jgi:methionine-rich copper-binding protein CopC